MSAIKQHLQLNYKFYILALFFAWLGYFDVAQQNQFLTSNYRLPFFAVGIFGISFICYYAYAFAQLCPTQSLNYRKVTFTTSLYWLFLMVGFFAIRDPAKAQLTVLLIGLLISLIFFYHTDRRLPLRDEQESREYAQAVAYEQKGFKTVYLPAFLIAVVLQVIFYMYVDFKFFLFFNPFFQLAFAIAVCNFAFALIETRLDNYKLFIGIIEIMLLALGVLLFFIIFYKTGQFDFEVVGGYTSTQAQEFRGAFGFGQIISLVVTILAIALISLCASTLKAFKGVGAALIRFAQVVLYFSLFLIAKGLLNT